MRMRTIWEDRVVLRKVADNVSELTSTIDDETTSDESVMAIGMMNLQMMMTSLLIDIKELLMKERG